MKVLSSLILIILITFLSGFAFSSEAKKVLLVSDIDDTIKISHVLNKESAAARATNITAVFTGMSQLYQLITREKNVQVTYLSNAPDEIAGLSPIRALHQKFLNYNHFPAGDLLLRKNLQDQNHKITQLRRLINENKPDVMILIGDNGERDAEIYHQFSEENKDVKMITFIHLLYSVNPKSTISRILNGYFSTDTGKPTYNEQFGFVTPIEIALQLNAEGLLSNESQQWMVDKIAPVIVRQTRSRLDIIGETTFPAFEDCSDFTWRWPVFREITPLVEKIKLECK